MRLKPQDIVVLVKLLEYGVHRPTYAQIAQELHLSASEVHAAVRRARQAHLLHGPELGEVPNKTAFEEFLIHGLKYVFPAERGGLARGVPTSYAAEPLRSRIAPGSDPPPVWPYPAGKARGYSLAPLYKTVPQAALGDSFLYEMLALIDAIRDGKSREREAATQELRVRLNRSRHAEPKH
ncbi:MAG TPA: hypothetical protein VJX29_01105 [Candidatus Acidoferrales bacterium]|nr:hypothetical protein [Candidatus Acidoferrales bacterium]